MKRDNTLQSTRKQASKQADTAENAIIVKPALKRMETLQARVTLACSKGRLIMNIDCSNESYHNGCPECLVMDG